MEDICEKSCGAIVYTRSGGRIEYAIIKSLSGFYGFPKGHMEAGESEQQTAKREICEETGLVPRLIPGFRETDTYPLPDRANVIKQVVYFVAECGGRRLSYQPAELQSAQWMSYEEALQALQFDSIKQILTKAHAFVTAHE